MKLVRKKWFYFISGLALLMLLVLPVWKLMTYVVADQTTGSVVKANLLLERTITNNDGIPVSGNIPTNQNIQLNYTITPQAVADSNTSGVQQQIVSQIVFTEKLPAKLDIQDADLPSGFSKSGSLVSGYTVTGSLPDITYTWNQEKQAYIADPGSGQSYKVIQFSLSAQVSTAGSYSFNSAVLTFDDIHAAAVATATPSPVPAATFDPSASTTSSLLGVAGDYNVFVFGDAKISASLAGNLASGGTTTTSGVSINQSNGASVPYAIVTGGDLNFTNGTVYGNILHQGEYLKNDPGNIVGGTYKKGSLLDFSAARTYYEAYSSKLASVQAVGTTTELKYGGLYATATQAVSVFDFTSDYYNQAGWTSLSAPSGASLIFNIRGTTVNFTKAFSLPSGVSGNNVIYNFPDATSVSISSGEYRGSILAPKAAISFTNGQIHGNIIGASINSSSTIGILPYKGQLPALPTPSPTATATPTTAPAAITRVSLEFPGMDLTVIEQVTDILLEGTTLAVGESRTLTATIVPPDASIPALQWSSANPSIVSVDENGQVTGVAVGTTQITASATDGSGISRTVDVVVTTVIKEVTDIQLEGTDLLVGKSKQLTAVVVPADASALELEWTSSNSSIVTVDGNGVVTGVAAGTAQITASATDGSGISRTVNVIVRSLEIGGESTIPINRGLDLTAIYSGPEGESGMAYQWSVIGEAAGAAVNPEEGQETKFTASAPGSYTVQLSFTSNSTSAPVVVTKQITVITVPLTSFEIIGEQQVYVGRTLDLSLNLNPSDVSVKSGDIHWSISGDNNGINAALGNSDPTNLTNTLIAKKLNKDISGNIVDTTVTVTVTIGTEERTLNVSIRPMSLQFSSSNIKVVVGEQYYLTSDLYRDPLDIPVDQLEWTSSNKSIASFSNINEGTITANAPGNITATVRYKPSDAADPVTATITVQVSLPSNEDKY